MRKTIRFVSTTTFKGIQVSRKEGIRHRLRYHNGMMRDWYEWEKIAVIATAYDRKKPIAKAILLNVRDTGINIGVYVRPEYRRQGIGKRLAQLIKRRNSTRKRKIIIRCAFDGRAGSQFYASVGIQE